MALISERMTYSSFYVTAFPIGPLLGVPSYSVRGGGTGSWGTYTYIMKSRLAVSFGGVVDRERKHPGEEASGIRGTQAPGRRIDMAFLSRLAFGPNPIGAPGQRAPREEGQPGVPWSAGLWAWSHWGSWVGPVG